jgi:hypothetical protein
LESRSNTAVLVVFLFASSFSPLDNQFLPTLTPVQGLPLRQAEAESASPQPLEPTSPGRNRSIGGGPGNCCVVLDEISAGVRITYD